MVAHPLPSLFYPQITIFHMASNHLLPFLPLILRMTYHIRLPEFFFRDCADGPFEPVPAAQPKRREPADQRD